MTITHAALFPGLSQSPVDLNPLQEAFTIVSIDNVVKGCCALAQAERFAVVAGRIWEGRDGVQFGAGAAWNVTRTQRRRGRRVFRRMGIAGVIGSCER